jgi:putative glycerol-1-phosphate prenyltransferase
MMRERKRDILDLMRAGAGQIAVLLDPDKIVLDEGFANLLIKIEQAQVSFLFVGGSTVTQEQQKACVQFIKKHTSLPLVIFPGSPAQICNEADALLFLNLISGRNPKFLIEHQVSAAPKLLETTLEVIPTAYVLIDGGNETAVQRVSKTKAISHEDFTQVLHTCAAGSFMGNQIVYLDSGSGAGRPLPAIWISEILKNLNTCLIVGGGIRTIEGVKAYRNAGANVIVIGNHIEQNPQFLEEIRELSVNRVTL